MDALVLVQRYDIQTTSSKLIQALCAVKIENYRYISKRYRMEIWEKYPRYIYIYFFFDSSIIVYPRFLCSINVHKDEGEWKIEKLGVNQSIPSFNTFNYSTAVLHRVLLLTSLPRTLDTCHIPSLSPLRYVELPHALQKKKKNCMGIGGRGIRCRRTTFPRQGRIIFFQSWKRERERTNVRSIIDVIANSQPSL